MVPPEPSDNKLRAKGQQSPQSKRDRYDQLMKRINHVESQLGRLTKDLSEMRNLATELCKP